MASEGADDERTGGADGTRAAAAGREPEARRDRETDRRNAGAGGQSRASDAPGAGDPQATDAQTAPVEANTAAAVAAAEAAGPSNGETVRLDSWIWSVRLVKTRSMGATACRGGHVRVNGERVKPAYSVRVGDEVRLRHEGRERIVVVKRLIRKRVGAPVAAQCYIDNSPPPPPREAVAPAGVRDRGMGRPTKRDRREMERLRGLGAPPGGGFSGQGPSTGSGGRNRSKGQSGSGAF
ncbi:RNA-binding S4 domain-containing protein [Streptomyces yaanensis]|uniref:RNA-binding S4 domain-containing protein n=1 Tax=Streptomyces yaanensis TaxID=1142239 RepID=A0ABV7SHX5_9ACTN|nr:RNA-binding S4 domain-containing protein [Streptomyces sp. CGMCC 4.7035]WNC01223.1 RNA-binding S4 domain-containing protein [Streptomyces sp. CGMCC 4.7035]